MTKALAFAFRIPPAAPPGLLRDLSGFCGFGLAPYSWVGGSLLIPAPLLLGLGLRTTV